MTKFMDNIEMVSSPKSAEYNEGDHGITFSYTQLIVMIYIKKTENER